MKILVALVASSTLFGCNGKSPVVSSETTEAGVALDKQAIDAGILPNPEDLEFAGRFETRGDFGANKFCAVSNGSDAFRIGVLTISGAESKCEGKGTAKMEGDRVRMSLQGQGACEFDAQYDGVELRLPEPIASGCATYCTANASLAGTRYFMLQNGDEPARRTLGRDIEKLCE